MNETLKTVVDKSRDALQDTPKEYWSDAELVDLFNEARDVLYANRPRVYETTDDEFELTEGITQTLPYSSNKLFDVLANVSHADKRAITPMQPDIFERVRPRWRSEAASDEVLHYMYREMQPTKFEVYPPVEAGVTVSISFAKPPTAFTLANYQAVDQTPFTLTQERELGTALVDYVVGKAMQKNADTDPEMARLSADRLSLFAAKIKGESDGRTGTSPNTRATGSARPDAPGQ